MRKHSVRKFIHAVLDCLPLLVIPIFAIYSQNHEINDNTLQVQENKVVDFNSIEANVKPFCIAQNEYLYTINQSFSTQYNTYVEIPIINNHIYAFKGAINTTYENITSMYVNWSNQGNIMRGGNFKASNTITASLYIQCTINANVNFSFYNCFYDLTLIFGEGNEPTYSQFETYFPDSYYPYTESEEVVIENYETITYNDTDIMSQFMYVTYNAVDKYFNMNKVFNLGNIWQWVNNTLFGGQAPLSAFIVYNVIAYEFIMDIIFLVYAVFMFIIDFAENCIDKAFYKSKRGIIR